MRCETILRIKLRMVKGGEKNMKKNIIGISAGLLGVLMLAAPAFAHVVVKPNQVGVAAFQTFTMGVPNEKDNPTVALKLLIPDGLKSVSPNVKPGWKVDIKKTGDGEDAKVTEIDWTNGSIPAGQRDDFVFSAQVPSDETTINWKAYQTYSDGKIVTWDQEPKTNMTDADREEMEKTGKGPYSQTKVVNDLTASSKSDHASDSMKSGASDKATTTISVVALALSAVALGMQLRNRKK
jgi:uncharacterized protein YcnI